MNRYSNKGCTKSKESENILSPNEIDLPSHLVDGYVIADNIEKDHRQTNKYTYHKGLLNHGECNDKITLNDDPPYKKIIAKNIIVFDILEDKSKNLQHNIYIAKTINRPK